MHEQPTAPTGPTGPSPDPSDPYQRGRLDGRRQGAYGALRIVRQAARTAGPRRVAEILGDLVSADDLGAVLRQLEKAADQADQP